jgi:hypothetical protein
MRLELVILCASASLREMILVAAEGRAKPSAIKSVARPSSFNNSPSQWAISLDNHG